ncbi:GGDEF domain-containing protein [Acholeplasma sp. OttesenSCG-928-E16]|nr:GGDEF domain-containing protein [Acholeplasma sp. OttesenSCG-928-E16]
MKNKVFVGIYCVMCVVVITLFTVSAILFYTSSKNTIITSTESRLVSNVNAATVLIEEHLDEHITLNGYIKEYNDTYIKLNEKIEELEEAGKTIEEIEDFLKNDPTFSNYYNKALGAFDITAFSSLVDLLSTFSKETAVTGIYTLVLYDSNSDGTKDQFVFVLDTDPAIDTRGDDYEFPSFSLGDTYVSKESDDKEERELFETFYQAITNKDEVFITRDTDQFGSFFMGFRALLDENGEVIAIICVDIEDSLITQNKNSFLISIISLEVVVFLTFSICGYFIVKILKKNEKMQDEIERMAYYDTLTKLPNRASLMSELGREVENQNKEEKEEYSAALFIDLDNFKTVNDTKGHLVGDKVLQDIADFLRHSISSEDFISRPGGGTVDFIARLGGDEFIVILNDSDKEKALAFTEGLFDKFKEFFKDNRVIQEFSVSLSVGIKTFNRNNFDPNKVLKSADEAMYKAKRQGKGKYFFSEDE